MVTKYDVEHDCDDDIIASFFDSIPSSSLSSMSYAIPENDDTVPFSTRTHEYRIRLANTEERQESASVLVNRMYEWRGYKHLSPSSTTDPNRITLITSGNDDEVIGTVSVGLDCPHGLFADQMYHEELEELRSQGRKVCEFTGLAVDPAVKSKRVLASLFQIAILYPFGVFDHTDGVLEVNPRHVRFYEKMVGFTRIGPERICPRVNAPSVLMRAEFSYVAEQTEKYGGLMDKASGEKSLYPYFFSKKDTEGILGRLKFMT